MLVETTVEAKVATVMAEVHSIVTEILPIVSNFHPIVTDVAIITGAALGLSGNAYEEGGCEEDG
jgi:hypothetical protein